MIITTQYSALDIIITALILLKNQPITIISTHTTQYSASDIIMTALTLLKNQPIINISFIITKAPQHSTYERYTHEYCKINRINYS